MAERFLQEATMVRRASVLELKEFPRVVNELEERLLLAEVQKYLIDDRPQLVLDCSRMGRMDSSSITLLLSCLEEAILRNGDVKLAAVPAEARATMRVTGVDRIFEIFETNTEAANSFWRISGDPATH
jgi:anti-anti-sigma factor